MNPKQADTEALLSLLKTGCEITFPFPDHPYMRGVVEDGEIAVGNGFSGGLGRHPLNAEGVEEALNNDKLFPLPRWHITVRAKVTLMGEPAYKLSEQWMVYNSVVNCNGDVVFSCKTPIEVLAYDKNEAINNAKFNTPNFFNRVHALDIRSVEMFVNEEIEDDIYIIEP